MNDYVGLPFLEKGRDRDGLDCWGLVRLVYLEKYGIELPAYTECYKNTKDKTIGGVIDENLALEWQEVSEPAQGDIIVLRILGQPFHVGLVIDGQRMLHCERGVGSVIENYKGMKWRKRVIGFYRLK